MSIESPRHMSTRLLHGAALAAEPLLDRRGFFSWASAGLGGAALASLLVRGDRTLAAPLPGEAADGPPHLAPRAKRAIHICLCGALSQVDSFDYKPALAKYHGQPLPTSEKPDVFFGQVGLLRKNDWDFAQRGQSGLWVSNLFPAIAEVADELTVIQSMVAETSNHTPATFQENSGFRLNGFPSLGSWLSYGLGAETDELPAFVVIPDARGRPAGGTINWTNGFLPARHQGVVFRSQGPAIDDLSPAQAIDAAREQATRDAAGGHEPPARGDARSRRRAAGPDAQLRAGRQDADCRARGDEPRRRDGRHARAVRDRPGRVGRLWPRLPAGAAADRARRAVRAALFRRVVRQSAHQLGRPREHDAPTTARRRRASTGRWRGCCAICGSAACSTTRWCCSRPSSAARRSRSRPPNVVGLGRDHNQYGFTVWLAGAGLKHGMAYGRDGRLRLEGGREARAPGTTFTPRCCTCWASTTSG